MPLNQDFEVLYITFCISRRKAGRSTIILNVNYLYMEFPINKIKNPKYSRKTLNTRYRNWFVTQYITYLNIWGEHCPHCQPMTDWYWFGILLVADLLPSTGFKIC